MLKCTWPSLQKRLDTRLVKNKTDDNLLKLIRVTTVCGEKYNSKLNQKYYCNKLDTNE